MRSPPREKPQRGQADLPLVPESMERRRVTNDFMIFHALSASAVDRAALKNFVLPE
jgi:hypothetical protein